MIALSEARFVLGVTVQLKGKVGEKKSVCKPSRL